MSTHADPSIELAQDVRHYLSDHQLSYDMPDITYEVFALYLIDSVQQVDSLKDVENQVSEVNDGEPNFIHPNSPEFDPIKAIFWFKDRDYDEACWLSFLLIYTDDSAQTDWVFMRLLYGGVGLKLETPLTWQVVNDNANAYMLNERLQQLSESLASTHPKPKFGKHRAYESLSHLPIVFSSYVSFIHEQGGHSALFKPVQTVNNADTGNDTDTKYFHTLYNLIRQHIYRFGRLSTFEYLCLLGETGLASISPDGCYIADASGPKRGAKLLFGMLGNVQLDDHARALADEINVGYQAMEIALCQWQKSPNRYIKHD